METRILRGLAAAIAVILPAALIAGLFVPIYSDEIGWRFHERAGFDGVDKMFSDVCGANTLAAPPWFMWPFRWYSAVLNAAFADPFWIRVSGILYALAWVALALLLVRRLTADRDGRAQIVTIGLGLLTLGTTPFVLVLSRPEQPMILAAVAALLMAFADGVVSPRPTSTARQAWLRSAGVAAASCVAISYHAKGLFLLPLMLACLFYASRGTKALIPRIVAALFVLGTTASATIYWKHRLECPDNAVLARAYDAHNLSGAIAEVASLDQAWTLLGRLLGNIDVFTYVATVGPQVHPLASWLAENQIGEEASFAWFLAMCALWALALIAAVFAIVTSILRDLRERRLDPRVAMAIVTFGIAAAWSATQIVRNFYDSKFVLPLLALGIVLALSTARSERLKPLLNMLSFAIGIFALASPVAIGAIYAPSFARAAAEAGRLTDQPQSLGVFGYSRLEPDILATAKLCRIDPAKAHAPMIDDVTYFAMMHSRLPQHELGVLRGWNGDIADPIGYLKSRGSDGAVIGCHLVPPAQRGRARSVGKFCCFGPPDW